MFLQKKICTKDLWSGRSDSTEVELSKAHVKRTKLFLEKQRKILKNVTRQNFQKKFKSLRPKVIRNTPYLFGLLGPSQKSRISYFVRLIALETGKYRYFCIELCRFCF